MENTMVQASESEKVVSVERALLTSKKVDKEYAVSLKRDKDLHARIMGGDREAFGELWEHYRGLVFKNCKLMLKNIDDANEATDEIGLKVFKNIATFNPNHSMVPWLKKITKNHCINVITRKVKYPTVFVSEADTKEGKKSSDMIRYNNTPDTMFRTPLENTEASEMAENTMKVMNLLSEPHRQIITLVDVEGYSYDEVATELGIAMGTVMSRLFNARKKFQKHYRELTNIPTGSIFRQ